MPNVYTFPKRADLPKFPPVEYKLSAKAKKGEIILYGVIGDPYDGISAKQFVTDLKKMPALEELDVRINSPGGFVSEGRTIFNRLKAFPAKKKTVYVDGEASSIASLIAMAGDEIVMGEGSLMLVHRAWGLTIGNADDHQKAIQDLETVDKTLVETYCARTKMKPDECLKLMQEDRYMDAHEAVERGFADVAEGGMKMAALVVDRQALRLPALPAAADPSRQKAAASISRIRAALAA